MFVDGYTYNFAYLGSRTTGNGGGRYLLAGPDGEKPAGIDAVIRSDASWRWCSPDACSGRDIDRGREYQAGYQVAPLSS